MKRNKFLPGLLIMLGLLALLIPTALAQGPSYQVFYDYDEELCSFELYCSSDLVQNGDLVTNPGIDASLLENEVSLWFEITDIAEGYRIKEVLVNGVEIPYCTEGYYGAGSCRITRDSYFQVILEEIPDTLPGIERVEFYTADEYSGDWAYVDAIMFEYGVCERLWAKVYTTDGYITSYYSPDFYPDFLFSYEWEYSIDGTNWVPIDCETRNEIYAPYAGAAPDHYEGYFMELRNYYLRVKVHGDERHYANADAIITIPVNNPNAMSQGYKLTLNYDPSLCTLTPIVFDGEYGEEVENGAVLPPESEVVVFLDDILPGTRIRDCLVNGFRYSSWGSCYAQNLMSERNPSISFSANGNITVDLVLDYGGTLPSAQSATISAGNSSAPLHYLDFSLNPPPWLEVDVIYENGANAPSFHPICTWEYSTDGGNTWTEIYPRDTNRFQPDPYRHPFLREQNLLLRAKLIGRTNYCLTSNGSYIFTDPVLVNSSVPVVFFNSNRDRATDVGVRSVGADGTLSDFPIPEYEGYRFDGWYTQPQGGTKITSETVFTRNTNVYAHWTTAHPMPTIPQILPKFEALLDIGVEQAGKYLAVTIAADEALSLSQFSSWVAEYDENGRMAGLQRLTGTLTDDGIRFAGTVNGPGDKLFLLGSEIVPVIGVCVSE